MPDGLQDLTPMLGSRVYVVNSPYDEGSGGDVDCVVEELDERWPLRLMDGWRLCQCLHYDMTGWYWVLERDGEFVALDSLDDVAGIGKYAYPTGLLDEVDREAAVAAYLTSKRILKGIRDEDEWARISQLARSDRSAYATCLKRVFGARVARRIAETVLQGQVPSQELWRRARIAQLAHRMRGPAGVAAIARRAAARVIERVANPTGLVVLVVGPDGSGKSTVAQRLPDACRALFRRSLHIHWRPGLLPRPGSLVGREQADPTEPHASPPRGRMASFAFLFYYWLDFMLGDWTRVRATKSRSGLVVWERGWWDFAVDPARYRLKVPGSLVRALGKLLPRPDLVMFLGAPPEVLHARKSELSVEELARQNRAWELVVPSGIRQISVDAEGSLEQVVASTRDAITSHLEKRAVGRLSTGWATLPRRRDPRWVIPRGPRRVVRSALLMYQPVTPLGLGGWNAARVMARFGGFRLLPRSGAPPQEVRELLAPYVPPRGSFAVMRVRGSGRYVAMVLDGTGRPVAFAKVATEERGMAELQSEVRAISTLGSMLAPPASAPHIIDAAQGILVLGAVEWRPRLHPWRLPEQLAGAMGAFFAKGTGDHRSGTSHGDFAPWNVLRDGDGWVVVDWEHASSERPPMFDLFHYLVQGHALLGQPKAERLLEGLRGRGWVGLAIGAYCESAGLDPSEAGSYLVTYLQDTQGAIDLSTSDGRRGQRARTALLAGLSMTSPAKGP